MSERILADVLIHRLPPHVQPGMRDLISALMSAADEEGPALPDFEARSAAARAAVEALDARKRELEEKCATQLRSIPSTIFKALSAMVAHFGGEGAARVFSAVACTPGQVPVVERFRRAVQLPPRVRARLMNQLRQRDPTALIPCRNILNRAGLSEELGKYVTKRMPPEDMRYVMVSMETLLQLEGALRDAPITRDLQEDAADVALFDALLPLAPRNAAEVMALSAVLTDLPGVDPEMLAAFVEAIQEYLVA